MSLPPPLPLARIREHEDEPNRESPPPGEPLATFSDDLQPLFQQLVFECKVHSALYGAAFACLSHAFHRWLHASAPSLDDFMRVSQELAKANQKKLLHTPSAAAAASPLTDDTTPKHTPSRDESDELAAFRTARQQLQREAAENPTPEQTGGGYDDSPAREEADAARRRCFAWQAALLHTLATLDPDSAGRRMRSAPLPAEATADGSAASACTEAVDKIIAW